MRPGAKGAEGRWVMGRGPGLSRGEEAQGPSRGVGDGEEGGLRGVRRGLGLRVWVEGKRRVDVG